MARTGGGRAGRARGSGARRATRAAPHPSVGEAGAGGEAGVEGAGPAGVVAGAGEGGVGAAGAARGEERRVVEDRERPGQGWHRSSARRRTGRLRRPPPRRPEPRPEPYPTRRRLPARGPRISRTASCFLLVGVGMWARQQGPQHRGSTPENRHCRCSGTRRKGRSRRTGRGRSISGRWKGGGPQPCLIAEMSNSRTTLSPTRTPPPSRAAFQVTPKSLREMLTEPSRPTRRLP